MRGILLAFLILIMVGVTAVSAHPFTEETVPPRFSSAPVGISEVIVRYSEAIEINHSALKVFDGSGEQIDNRDTRYHEGDYSLIVTTAPLSEGAYTVTSKVLSRVDGHLVPSAFVFGVGDVTVEAPAREEQAIADLVFFPEAGARFPGLVGQTVILGAVIASMFVWGTQRRDPEVGKKLDCVFHGKFMSLVGLGIIVVFASNILMLAIQTLRLEASVFDSLQTSFGTTWTIRMAVTVALLAAWFAMERAKRLSFAGQIPLLALSLVLIATTTMMGHGMASEQPPAVALDYIHNLVAAAWIGGILFFAFVLLPSFGALDGGIREKMSLASIPRFSIMIVIAIGIVAITGPTLMWMLEGDVKSITESTYGKLIIAKILLAGAMIGVGGYHQFGIQRVALKDISAKISVSKKLGRALRIEAVLGIALLGIVALLTNGTLPEGETQTVQADAAYGYTASEFADQVRFDVDIFPFAAGANTITVRATDLAGNSLPDLGSLKVKVSNPQRGITPIEIPVERDGSGSYGGDVTFGFSGRWQVEIEAQRTQSANDAVTLDLLVKPRLDQLDAKITEYELPVKGAPLYPEYDGRGNIWITDASHPRLWKFSIQDEAFTEYEFDGQASITLEIDSQGRVWFTDVPAGKIGYLDPETELFEIIEFSGIAPEAEKNFVIALDEDDKGGMWASVANKNAIVRYDHATGELDVYELPTADSGPFAVAVDHSRAWFTQNIGQIGYVELDDRKITELAPDAPLATPETITFDSDGNLWIAEHRENGWMTRYSPVLDSFERVRSPDEAAFPNSASLDKYQNVWFAMHTVDKLAAYDPHNGDIMTVPIPTEESWVQFTTSDDGGNIWFVEQKPSKLAVLELTESPAGEIRRDADWPEYTEIASPIIALGVIAASLFFVKGVQDKRKINALVYK